ncbi:MAG: hypothetical protein N3E45_09415 [Oscillatoriaceae bacterium SKW80]|nr:hypothetical protein [Oscillatoriaceae bacterium SKYG93]MCX8121032.1 hypothetical protein [Oscillatoriaceae bacterium SKW80]MDW8452305.1 hypothetical protein [Oscillatoriaceae cyanobacterium SKYGB_i_bin93]HIK26639.1 hypothetical protein [Oscillatoriaceae cyanobacterium M7585_C2015_266]
MSEIRNWLLFAIAVFLAIFAAQNASPSLSLVFLGMQSVALPLSAWVILALVSGVFTSFLISALFKLSNYQLEQELTARRRTMPRQIPSESTPQWKAAKNADLRSQSFHSVAISQPPQAEMSAEYSHDADETLRSKATTNYANKYSEPEEDDDSFYEEWEQEERERTAKEPQFLSEEKEKNQVSDEAPIYEIKQEPKSISWSGTIYSYTYRSVDESESETTPETNKSVADAEYRVIEPPVRDLVSEQPIQDITPEQPPEDDWLNKKKKKTDWD